MLVCSGRMTFKEMVEKSQATDTARAADPKVISLVAEAAPLLAGLSLTEYQALEIQDNGEVTTLAVGSMELRQLIASLHLELPAITR